MFHIHRYGTYKNQIVLLGQIDSLHTTTILSYNYDEDEGRRRMKDNSSFHTTLFDPSTQSWWSIYNTRSDEMFFPPEVPCNFITRFDSDGFRFNYKEMKIPQHVWQHVVGMIIAS